MDLELPPFSILLITFLLLISMVLKREKRIKTNGSTSNLPPAPLKLPIIGNLHNLVGCLPHHGLRDLAKKYGPLKHLQLGELSTVVVPSPKFGREVMKSHDIVFASRPHNLTTRIISYDSNDIAFSPYGDYRKQLRKICISELLSPKRVLSYRSIREEEVFDFINRIASKAGSPVNLTNKTYSLIYVQEQGDLEFPFTTNCIKAVILDIFTAGSETSATTIDWAMCEMMKNPKLMKKAQMEVREVFNRKGKVDESGIEEMKFLKLVIRETLRLHPPVPMLLPRECWEKCEINGFEIPTKATLIVNAWAIGRDPEYWTEPESFIPERFLDSFIDYKGTNFEYIPFGAGRRICPGITFGMANVELPLAMLLYHFDWKLPNGKKPEDMNMSEAFGVAVRRKDDLCMIPIPYHPSPEAQAQGKEV
ncbi:hypothetical protein KPL71_002016 [Citrus sinensis]|uniref:Uncharacterized protein n=1 Tax=Citrus sinensis TaxID=2711 RepID=A0ACB8P227_CITSI|nr:hypothetical protein KPL71_002016 [Citrus sinensis]